MNLFAEAKNVLDKDGKVNALGPYGKQKLTGREMSTYFRRNKVNDATIKKAVEVALDLGGADTIARKEIKKFYGDKVLKSKEVQQALKYANEAVSPAQQAAIAISKKEKGEKPLDEYAGKGGQPEGEIARRQRHIDDLKQKYREADYWDGKDILKKIKDLQNKLDDRLRQLNNSEETIVEKVSYVEYKFKNKNDAQRAMNMFKSTNLISLDINDDNLNGGELAVDAGKKDMSKLHKDVMKKFRPTIQMQESPEARAKLALKHAQDMKKLKDKQTREKEAMQESDMQNVDNAPKNKWKALGFSQHPHKGFEGERLPQSMRDFRKKAMTNTQKKKSLMDTYKEMWEDGEKYAPIEENMERSIMKKMRKGRVAKGMPR